MRAFFGVFLAFFTLIALFLRPLSNYYEAKYQKDFFITDERAMVLSDKFINIAEDGLQSAKSAFDKFMRVFWAKFSKPDLKGDRVAMSVATQNQTVNLNTQNDERRSNFPRRIRFKFRRKRLAGHKFSEFSAKNSARR